MRSDEVFHGGTQHAEDVTGSLTMESSGVRRKDASPCRILLAEDDKALRSLLTGALIRSGYEVVAVADGTQLLEALGASLAREKQTQDFDLVISDVRMPGWSGLQVLADLYGVVARPPMVLITAFGDDAFHRHARQLGALTMDKPLDVDDLRRVVSELLLRQLGGVC